MNEGRNANVENISKKEWNCDRNIVGVVAGTEPRVSTLTSREESLLTNRQTTVQKEGSQGCQLRY
jgi:hypothetical protein